MTNIQLYTKFSMLNSPTLRQQLGDYLDFLLSKQAQQEPAAPRKVPVFGCAKGKFHMAEDFNAPLEDFKEYMPE